MKVRCGRKKIVKTDCNWWGIQGSWKPIEQGTHGMKDWKTLFQSMLAITSFLSILSFVLDLTQKYKIRNYTLVVTKDHFHYNYLSYWTNSHIISTCFIFKISSTTIPTKYILHQMLPVFYAESNTVLKLADSKPWKMSMCFCNERHFFICRCL